MKNSVAFLLLLAGLLLGRAARAQGVGIGTATPDASAALDVASTAKGLLVPRVTAAQRAAIAAPATGLLVYQTDGAQPGFWFNAGTGTAPVWTFFNPAGGGADNLGNGIATTPVNLQGNALVGTGASISGVGVGVRADGGLNLGQNGVGKNVLVGYQAGQRLTPDASSVLGSNNQFSGYQSGASTTTGSFNQFNGHQAGFSTTGGRDNQFSGFQSGYRNTIGSNNLFSGYQAGFSNTTGNENQFTGSTSGGSNTTGSRNLFSGFESGLSNTTGIENQFSGYQAGYNNTTASNNLFIGYQSGYTTTVEGDNQFVGIGAGYANTTGGFNHFDGANSGFKNTTGSSNVFVGPISGYLNTTGSNNTVLGSSAGPLSGALQNTTALGYGAFVGVSNKIRLGDARVTVIEGQVPFSSPSDARFKYDVRPDVPGLAFVTRLRPVTYRLDAARQDNFQRTGTLPAFISDATAPLHTGFLAQEVEQAAQALGYHFDGVHAPANARDHYGLGYAQFVVPLVKAVQEQQTQIEALQTQNAALQTCAAQAEADHVALLRLQAQVARLLGEGPMAQVRK